MPAVTKMRENETALRKAHMLVGGKWVESASGEWLEVEDPAHRRPIAEVPRGRAEDVARAVKSAADAFPAWSRAVPRERGRLLARIAEALEARVEKLPPGEPFDTVVARAFAPLPRLLAQVRGLCGSHTRVLAMKGRWPAKELEALPPLWRLAGSRELNVPGLEEARCLLVLALAPA